MVRATSRSLKLQASETADTPLDRFQENIDRNAIIYELWVKGYTVDEIAFDTGIPRGSVGYYVGKFNRKVRKGEPIIIQQPRKKPDDAILLALANLRMDSYISLMKMTQEPDGYERANKILTFMKLTKELQRDLFPTEEELRACNRNFPMILKQLMEESAQRKKQKELQAGIQLAQVLKSEKNKA